MRETQAHTSAWASKYVFFLLICEKHKRIRQHGLLKEVISTHMRETQAHTSAWASKGGYFYSYARNTSAYVSLGFLRWLFLLICEKQKRMRQHGRLKMVISTHIREAQAHTSAWASKDGYFYSYARNTSAYVSLSFLRWLFLLICEKHKHIRQHGLLNTVISTYMREAQAHTSAWASKYGYFYSYARSTSAYVSMGVLRWLFLLIYETAQAHMSAWASKMVISTHMQEAQVHTSAWASKGGYFYSYARSTSTYVSLGV